MFEMEAVELSLPVAAAVEVSKILSVEGFSREGISAGGAEHRESSLRVKDPVFGRFPVPSRGSSSSTDTACRASASEQNSVSRTKKADAGPCMFHNSLPSYVDETTAPQDGKLLMGKQLQRKVVKSPKNSSFGSKRTRSEYVQSSISQEGLGDCNVLIGRQKSGLTECSFAERSPTFGQKNSIDGKRGDKRHFKPPTKPKADSIFSKAGLASSSSSAGGGSILGVYGLKSDIHDVTKHVDELSLNDLLDGSYKCPSLCQDKGKKAANTNEVLVHTIKRACSVLQPWKPVESQNSPELGSGPNRKLDTCILSSGLSGAGGTDRTKGDNYADLASSNKDTCTELSNSPLCQPKDILERLALPPAKNLDALLHDTSKSALSRSMNDLRLSKPMSCGASLPPFPWSNCSSGLSKTSTETGKLFCNRSRWVRIGSIVSSLGDAPSFLDMDLMNFDQMKSMKSSDATNLHNSYELALPQRCPNSFDWKPKLGLRVGNLLREPIAEGGESVHHENVVLMDTSLNHQKFPNKESNYTGMEHSGSHCSPLKCSVGGYDQSQRQSHTSEKLIHAEHSPRLLAAAQILYELRRYSASEKQNTARLRWPKKPSQKSMKARKLRPGKTEVLSSMSRLVLGLDAPVEKTDKTSSPNKSKYSINNKVMDISRTNRVGRGPMKWSVPTSSRSPPSRSENVEAKHLNSDSVKVGMMPSFKRSLDKACDNELRKAVSMDWGRGRSKNEC